MWQPLGSVAPSMCLIAKLFLGSPASPVPLCGTAAVARYPAARAPNPLMCNTFPSLPTAWHSLCFVCSYSRGSSGVRQRLLGNVSEPWRLETREDSGAFCVSRDPGPRERQVQ
jgi:hypothetical protein